MADRRFPSDADFWPHDRRPHADPRTRSIHAGGTAAGLVMVGLGLLAPLVGYGAARASHPGIEGNRPATFGHPLWSLGSDLRLGWLLATGRLDAELRRAAVRVA